MDHFLYKNGQLHAENVALSEIAATVGTPAYVYSRATLQRHYRVFDEALAGRSHLICYAVKANSNLAVLNVLAKCGAGADVVSEGEFRRALAAGIPGEKIVFSGVGKTASEMHFALANNVRQFNVESEPELECLSAVAQNMGISAPIALRVNPDVDAGTHEKISTGKSENKFGIPISQAEAVYAHAADLPGIQITGVDVHIGSQLTELAPFEKAFERVRDLTRLLRAAGHDIQRLDLGGGLGIPYTRSNEAPPLPMEYGAMIQQVFAGDPAEIIIEPGRLIVGNAGVLLSQVIYRKAGAARNFLIIDAAMNDLIRPAMYEAWHEISPVTEPAAAARRESVDVVGPICETGDTFAIQRALPRMTAGDLLVFHSAGAYGAVMASEYNSRPMIPEVMVSGDRFEIIRPRPTYDEMLDKDHMPEWEKND